MKKLLLTLGISAGLFAASNAQVIFAVESPLYLQGNYPLNYAKASNGWGVPDLTDTANAVLDTLAFVSDGTAGDSLGCNTLTNGPQITGKIAVVYRGTCQFGTKAKNAQNQGAVAVIIINNVPGDVTQFEMLGGDSGAAVTIPVIMISQDAGALLKNEIENGNVVGFIGNKFGYYNNDIGFTQANILRPTEVARPFLISQNASEYSVQLGAWIYNYGSDPQTNVTLNAKIVFNSSTIYDQTSTAIPTLAPGDSVYVTLPTFSQSTYIAGEYQFTYTASATQSDQFAADNVLNGSFLLNNNIYSLAPVDSNKMPIASAFYRPGASTGDYESCIHFRDAKASRLAVEGLYFAATTSDDDTASFPNTLIEANLYLWDNEFTDLDDPAFDVNGITNLAYGFYEFTQVSERGQIVYADFDNTVIMEDNKRYLFCVKTQDDYIYLGYNASIDYATNLENYNQPIAPIINGATFYPLGFGTDATPAIAVKMIDKNSVGIEEEQVTTTNVPYPNPANQVINIPMKGINGLVNIDITDMNGRLVKTIRANVAGETIQLDVTGISNGQYSFRITTADGNVNSFKVVVTK